MMTSFYGKALQTTGCRLYDETILLVDQSIEQFHTFIQKAFKLYVIRVFQDMFETFT